MRILVSRLKYLFLSSWHPFAWLFFLGLVLYARTLFFNLTFLDDQKWVLDYQWFLGDPHNFLKLFLRPDHVTEFFYRPVMALSFMLNAFVSGTSPWSYHLLNIILHNANAYLVFVLLQRFGYDRIRSFVVALIFLVHPVFVTAVAWIPGRTDSLVALFIFSSFLFFMDFIKERKVWALVGHFVFFILALLSKEIALILPFVCAAYFIFFAFSKGDPSKTQPKAHLLRKEIAVVVTLWSVILLVWFWVRKIVLGAALTLYFMDDGKVLFSLVPNFVIQTGKMLFPFNLTVVPFLKDTTIFYGIAAIVVLIVLIIFSKQKRLPFIWLGFSWSLLFLVPSCLGAEVLYEYRMYIPFFGVMVVLLETDFIKNFFGTKRFWKIFGIMIIIGFAAATFYYSASFKDQFTFWRKAVNDSPHFPLAHANLGAMYYLDGQAEPAIYEYNKALYLNPGQKMIHNNLGIIFLGQGQWFEAEKEFAAEINANPLYVDAYYNFALLRYQQGRRQEARQLIIKALEINPDFVDGYQALAADYSKEGDQKQATRYLDELRKRNADASKDFLQNRNL